MRRVGCDDNRLLPMVGIASGVFRSVEEYIKLVKMGVLGFVCF